MQRLILLRHAKSDYPPGVPDHDRPLNARGRRNAATIADRLRPYLPTGSTVVAAVSTATRTQETWEIVNRSLAVHHWNDRTLYLANRPTLQEVASVMEADVGIIVGHNPGLEEFARLGGGSAESVDVVTGRRLAEKFPTSAFAVLESRGVEWDGDRLSCTGFAVCR